MSSSLDEVYDLLQAHVNRDKVVSLSSYILKLWGVSSKREPLVAAAARIATARATLRLFDDAAIIKALLKQLKAIKQEGLFWGSLGVAGSAFTLAYLQSEKLVFLLDTGIVKVSPATEYKIRTAYRLFWATFASIGLIRSVNGLHQAAKEINSKPVRKCTQARFTQASLTTTKALFDTVLSVGFLPKGWLWGDRLSQEKLTIVAIISGILGLTIHYHGKRLG